MTYYNIDNITYYNIDTNNITYYNIEIIKKINLYFF